MKRHISVKQKDDYNTYMREYQRIYYEERHTDWKTYLLRRRYRQMTLDKLHAMLEHKLSTMCTMSPEKKERIVKVLREIIAEKERIDYEPKEGIAEISDELDKLNREVHKRGL